MKETAPASPSGRNDATQAVMEMRGVSVGARHDPGVIVAEDVNWRVAPGEFWAVAGLHGAGKSDLLMMAGGVTGPAAGTYEFLGERMPIFSEDRLAHRMKMGLVFDNGRLFNQLTVAENVALPLRYHRNWSAEEAEACIGNLLELTGLSARSGDHPGALGRNWQRRAALARALALQPELLLLDAPLAGLDLRQQDWWLNFLAELSRGHPLCNMRPVTLVVTTENLRSWHGHAQRFALLDGKRFTVLGDWHGVEQSPDPLARELAANRGS